MQDTPRGLRLHIGLFGRRNAGKSSLLNALAGQDVAIVSDTPGTTTDPVEAALELAPVGPVLLLDTAGLDDEGEQGEKRAARALETLDRVDVAIVVTTTALWSAHELRFVATLKRKNVPFFVVLNKTDDMPIDVDVPRSLELPDFPVLHVSARTGLGLDAVLREIERQAPEQALERRTIISDLLPEHGIALLVTPTDSSAPKGRLILPQVQTIRDLLDGRNICVVVTEEQLRPALALLRESPALVICDSQVMQVTAAAIPPSVPLTTFSVLMARLKGDLPLLAAGAAAIGRLKPGDAVLVQEACTLHPQNDDIGRVLIPRLLQGHVRGELRVDVASGRPPAPERDYSLIIHCGGCTLTRRQMLGRLRDACDAGVPITNYGVAISFMHGVLERALAPFPEALTAYREDVNG